jgi:DNA-binding CsgD family transcriptional regulator
VERSRTRLNRHAIEGDERDAEDGATPVAAAAPPRGRAPGAPGADARRSLVRRLALAKFRELRCAGLGMSEIVAQFGDAWPGKRDGAGRERRRGRGSGSARDRTGPHADAGALVCALDVVDQGLAFFTRDGVPVHTNRALDRALAAFPDDAPLRLELEQFAMTVCGVVRLRRLGGTRHVEEIEVRDVPTSGGSVRLRGSYVGLDLFGSGGCVLVALEPPDTRLLTAAELKARFGLSPRESCIAHLLADGRSNAAIAAKLFISPHTARTHTQRVLEKLDVGGRAQVASTIVRRRG